MMNLEKHDIVLYFSGNEIRGGMISKMHTNCLEMITLKDGKWMECWCLYKQILEVNGQRSITKRFNIVEKGDIS